MVKGLGDIVMCRKHHRVLVIGSSLRVVTGHQAVSPVSCFLGVEPRTNLGAISVLPQSDSVFPMTKENKQWKKLTLFVGGQVQFSLSWFMLLCVTSTYVLTLKGLIEMQVPVDSAASPAYWYWCVIAFFFSIMQFVTIQLRLYFWHFAFYFHAKWIRVRFCKSRWFRLDLWAGKLSVCRECLAHQDAQRRVQLCLHGWMCHVTENKPERSIPWYCILTCRTNTTTLLRFQVDV